MTFCGGKSLEILDLNENINALDPRPPFEYGLIFWVKKYNPTDQEVSDGQRGHLHLGYDIQEVYNHVRAFANRFFSASSIKVNTDGLKALVEGQKGLDIGFIPLESRTAGALLEEIESETPSTLLRRTANQFTTLITTIWSAVTGWIETICLKFRWIR
jgi:hypothetical protein